MKKSISLAIVIITISLSAWAYSQAEGETVSVCVNKSGLMYMFGEGFLAKKCAKGDQLITWNITGPQGPKGDTGEQGEMGPVGPKGDDGQDFVVPEPKTVIFAQDLPQPFNSDWVDVSGGYNVISIDLRITDRISDYEVQFTNDVNTEPTAQMRVNCNSQAQCPLITIPVLAKYYRVSTGTASGDVTAVGYLVHN